MTGFFLAYSARQKRKPGRCRSAGLLEFNELIVSRSLAGGVRRAGAGASAALLLHIVRVATWSLLGWWRWSRRFVGVAAAVAAAAIASGQHRA